MNYALMSYSLARQGYKPEAIVAAAAEWQFEWIDWVSTYGEPARKLRRLCRDAKVKIAAYTFFLPAFQRGDAGWREELRREMDTACELEAPLCMLPTPALDFVPLRTEGRTRWLEALAEFVRECERRNLIASVENYPGADSPLVTSDDYGALIRELPELMLTFDPGNAATGEPAGRCLERYPERIVHVHFKDWRITSVPAPGAIRMLDGRYYRPALVGEGDIGLKPILQQLIRMDYRGCINIEYESDALPAGTAMRKALAYLNRVANSNHPVRTEQDITK